MREKARLKQFVASGDVHQRRRTCMQGQHSRWWYLLLLPPYIAMFCVSSFNKVDPEWAGIPFFYWYQLLWIWLASGLTVIVYLATRSRDN
jgi:hypothetical protein